MTQKQIQEINEIEQTMRDEAFNLLAMYRDIKKIDVKSASKALAGIIQYLNEPLDLQVKLDDLEQNWQMGVCDKADYMKRKARLLS